jgi:hypothetical protein
LENKTKCKEKRPVKVEISVSEMVEVFKEIQEHPEDFGDGSGRYAKSSGGIFE